MADPKIQQLEELVARTSAIEEHLKSTEGAVPEEYHRIDSWRRLPVVNLGNYPDGAIVITLTERLIKALLLGLPSSTVYQIAASLASELKSTTDPYPRIIRQDELNAKCTLQEGSSIVEANEVEDITPGTAAETLYNSVITNRTRASAPFWGPAFAVLILRLEKRQYCDSNP